MIRLIILFVLAIGLANGQLNYEGNPLTEFTEYTAEESNLSEKIARQEDTINMSIDFSSPAISSNPQKLYPVSAPEVNKHFQQSAETNNNFLSGKSQSQSFSIQNLRSDTTSGSFARQFPTAIDQNSPVDPSEVALNTFLNSKTPEESRMSLDYYLQNQQSPEDQSQPSDAIVSQDKRLVQLDVQQQPIFQVEQRQSSYPQLNQPMQLASQMDQGQLVAQLAPQIDQRQQLVPQIDQRQQLVSHIEQRQLVPQIDQRQQLVPHVDQRQLVPQVDQRQQFLPSNQGYGYVGQPVLVQPAVGVPAAPGILQTVPLMPGMSARNDMITPAMWRQRMRRIRGKPFPFAQARIAPGMYKGPVAVPFKQQTPIEVIYTKPPGFHRAPPVLSNPPVPYEDASAWFPDASQPPPSKDVYYSQLYTQSYDPHYYNYIAATGKVRPHLYGKLGKRKEEQEDGIWSELYRGFTKHGLKNIMTPTFLLGMTLPVVTLMLSALVQKRSISRSDGARELDQEDALREYLERLQRAMECYGSRNSRDAKLNEC